MSINLIKIIDRIVRVPKIHSVSANKESVNANKTANNLHKKNHQDQINNPESINSKPESLIKLSSEELIAVFRKAECCTVDGLNEYDDDLTEFTPLGDVITHEMQKAADRLAKKALAADEHEALKSEFEHSVIAQNSLDEKQQ